MTTKLLTVNTIIETFRKDCVLKCEIIQELAKTKDPMLQKFASKYIQDVESISFFIISNFTEDIVDDEYIKGFSNKCIERITKYL